MTTYYPSQPTPQFLKKYTRNVYNRVQHNAHHDLNGQSTEETALSLQPYRSTPLVLPGAKVYQNKNLPTDCYLRHHPNPQMRAGPTHEYVDSMMKQKVADSVLHRVVKQEEGYPQQAASNGPKLVHKQFNSPIGLYSDNNIEHTIKNTISPLSPVASSMGSSSVPSPNGTLNRPHQHLPTKIEGVFIDMSFLEQKKRILEQQQQLQRHAQQQPRSYYGYSPLPQFNQRNF